MNNNPDSPTMTAPPISEPVFIRTLKGEAIDPPPVWMMRQAGRYLPEYRKVRKNAGSFLDLCYDPALACEVTLQPIRRYGFDAAIVFADILLIPDGLGQDVAFKEGEGPVLSPVDSAKAFAGLSMDRVHETVGPVYETLRLTRKGLPPETALIGFCGAPWTVATYMVGGRGSPDQKAARLAAYRRETWFGGLIDLLVEASVEYLVRQVEAGAQALQIFDTWAGNLAPGEYQRWCVEPVCDMVDALKSRVPDVPVIGFPRGCGAAYAEFAGATGVDAVSLDTSVDMAWASSSIPADVVLQGNLDPLAVVAGGRELDHAVDCILEAMEGRAFVFNLGHGLIPETPVDNVARVIERVRARGARHS